MNVRPVAADCPSQSSTSVDGRLADPGPRPPSGRRAGRSGSAPQRQRPRPSTRMNAPVLASGTSKGDPSRRWASRFSTRSVRGVVSVVVSPFRLDLHPVLGVGEPGPAALALDVYQRLPLDGRGQASGRRSRRSPRAWSGSGRQRCRRCRWRWRGRARCPPSLRRPLAGNRRWPVPCHRVGQCVRHRRRRPRLGRRTLRRPAHGERVQ